MSVPRRDDDAPRRAPGDGGRAPDRVAGLLGLARRAGRAVVGTEAVRAAASADELEMVVMATDASGNARKRIRKALGGRAVPVREWSDRDRLGRALGRGPVVAVGLTDPGLAGRLRAMLEGAPAGRARDL